MNGSPLLKSKYRGVPKEPFEPTLIKGAFAEEAHENAKKMSQIAKSVESLAKLVAFLV